MLLSQLESTTTPISRPSLLPLCHPSSSSPSLLPCSFSAVYTPPISPSNSPPDPSIMPLSSPLSRLFNLTFSSPSRPHGHLFRCTRTAKCERKQVSAKQRARLKHSERAFEMQTLMLACCSQCDGCTQCIALLPRRGSLAAPQPAHFKAPYKDQPAAPQSPCQALCV